MNVWLCVCWSPASRKIQNLQLKTNADLIWIRKEYSRCLMFKLIFYLCTSQKCTHLALCASPFEYYHHPWILSREAAITALPLTGARYSNDMRYSVVGSFPNIVNTVYYATVSISVKFSNRTSVLDSPYLQSRTYLKNVTRFPSRAMARCKKNTRCLIIPTFTSVAHV